MRAPRRLRWFHGAVGVGVGLSVVGGLIIRRNGGLGKAQWPSSTAGFNAHVGANLDDVLAANLADAVVFVPGYLLLGVGWAAWVRRPPLGGGRLGRAADAARWLVVVAAVTDTVENVLLRIAANDLPAGDGIVSAMKAVGAVKSVAFGVGFLLLVVTAVWRGWRRWWG